MTTPHLHSELKGQHMLTTPSPTAWIIEDEPKWQEAFTLILNMAFEQVDTVSATCKAETQSWFILDAPEKSFHWPDVVLMDWQLANHEDGLNLAERWVDLGLPPERVIIVSGSADIPAHRFCSVNKVEAATKLLPSIMALKHTA
jgi:CheY-like chemotaxis protein